MKKLFGICVLFLLSAAVFAQDVIAPQDFITQVLSVIKSMGGSSMMVKISAIIMLIIASMKVSFLNQFVWSKLGKFQIWVAPILGLLAGILDLAGGGTLSMPKVFAYLAAGAGAVFLHEILDLVKAIPGLGSAYVAVINLIEGALGGPAASA